MTGDDEVDFAIGPRAVSVKTTNNYNNTIKAQKYKTENNCMASLTTRAPCLPIIIHFKLHDGKKNRSTELDVQKAGENGRREDR